MSHNIQSRLQTVDPAALFKFNHPEKSILRRVRNLLTVPMRMGHRPWS